MQTRMKPVRWDGFHARGSWYMAASGFQPRGSSPVLAKLHWLPVSHRITYKIAVLTHKTLATSQPGYLSSSIQRRHLPHTVVITRSAAHNRLTLPNIRNFRSDFSRRGFANSAPTIWNNLPPEITDTTITRDVFVKRLKTHLYRLAYVD